MGLSTPKTLVAYSTPEIAPLAKPRGMSATSRNKLASTGPAGAAGAGAVSGAVANGSTIAALFANGSTICGVGANGSTIFGAATAPPNYCP